MYKKKGTVPRTAGALTRAPPPLRVVRNATIDHPNYSSVLVVTQSPTATKVSQMIVSVRMRGKDRLYDLVDVFGYAFGGLFWAASMSGQALEPRRAQETMQVSSL